MRAVTLAAISTFLALAPGAEGARAAGKGEIEQPRGTWQVPGPIQQPTGPWQKPGAIQVPKGIQAVKAEDAPCLRRISVVADALFDFNQSSLRADATETLSAAGPEIVKAGKHKITVEGHTDSIGSDAYNDRLSLARAASVRVWLAAHRFIPADSGIKGFGKRRPVAPNTLPDGKDDPAGRQKNRRVDIAIDLCDKH
jgi:outer membrane protein OmpA-like peptidoglycan-associated protein